MMKHLLLCAALLFAAPAVAMSPPNYPGPSPAAKIFTVSGIKCAIDIYTDTGTIDAASMVLLEQFPDGSWHFLSDETNGLIWTLYLQNSPLAAIQGFGATGKPQTSGSFVEIVASEGVQGMVYDWEPLINDQLARRFASATPTPQPVPTTDQRTPQEKAAQQVVAGGIFGLIVTITPGQPPVVSHR